MSRLFWLSDRTSGAKADSLQDQSTPATINFKESVIFTERRHRMSIYQKFGVEPIINACGSVTRLGGAPMPSEVLESFREAAAEWVPLEQLQAAASRKIAEHTGTEAGLVTSGAAGALTLGAAAILAGHSLKRMEQLPHCDGFPDEFIIAREQRSGYDHAVRAAGARLVEVGFNEIISNAGVRRTESWEYEAAITENTAGIVYVHSADSQPDLTEVVEVAREHGLPVLVDAAGEVPPRANLKAIAAMGADLVSFSGGKAIRGPQSTGILCGKRELISSAALQMLDMDDHGQLWEPPADFIDT
uniref:aminotransferase class V-fold PLP-dependent enzyme n=1 Tax=uncultured Gimesia sp. TaxID=1678688 RepID=UPI0026393779